MVGTIAEWKDHRIINGALLMKESAAPILVIMVTVGNQKEARRIGRRMVEAKLAACANIIPAIESIYRWKGKVLKSQEVLVIFKSTKVRYAALEKAIKAIHRYDTPEIIALPVKKGLPQYIGWVCCETSH